MKKTPFETALDIAEPVVLAVRVEHLQNKTPCTRWDVHALLNHLYNELAWVPELLSGKTVAQVGDALNGDLVGQDPVRAWRSYADTARKSAESTPPQAVVYLLAGNVPASAYLDEMAGELVIHIWDLSRGIGLAFDIPEDMAQALYITSESKVEAWRKQVLLGPAVPVPQGASHQVKLLGLFGRRA